MFLQCTRTDSLDVFFKDTQISAVPKIAVVGCGCSVATEPVAEISHHWNITQVLCILAFKLAILYKLVLPFYMYS